jgi:hypothetical protein
MTIRPTDESVAVEYSFHVLEVDSVIAQIAFALFRIPSERANAREQPPYIVRHSEAPQALGCDTSVSCREFAMTVSKR